VAGLQNHFDWRGVAASAGGAAVGHAVGGALAGEEVSSGIVEHVRPAAFADLGQLGEVLRGGLTGTAAGVTAAVMHGGRVNVQQVATDAFGNALGESIASASNGTAQADPLGDFINEQLAAQDHRDRYSLSGMSGRLSSWTATGNMAGDELARRKIDVEKQVHLDLLGQEARDASVNGAQMLATGGPGRGPARGIGSGGFEMVRNGNWDAALNIGADPYGVLPDLAGLQQDMSKMSRQQAESRISDMRQRMLGAGMKDVPTDYRHAWAADGAIIRDYGATVEDLQSRYEGFVRDNRLRATYGDDYQNLRIGKSQMSVLEFERRVLDLQQQATDRYYVKGVELIAKGDLQINGDYARTLGAYMDQQVRTELRFLAKAEGINDSMASNLWAVNRSIRSDLVEGRGIPDNRLGHNLFADTTLARKNGYTEQIMKWNTIRPEANYLMVRPNQLGGSYVIPRTSIQPFNLARPGGRGL
jgi:hypothetical protein